MRDPAIPAAGNSKDQLNRFNEDTEFDRDTIAASSAHNPVTQQAIPAPSREENVGEAAASDFMMRKTMKE